MVPEERSSAEEIAQRLGRNPGEVAALDRLACGLVDLSCARLRLAIACCEAAGSMRNLADAWAGGWSQIADEEAAAIAEHPDLAEVNVLLDNWYPGPT